MPLAFSGAAHQRVERAPDFFAPGLSLARSRAPLLARAPARRDAALSVSETSRNPFSNAWSALRHGSFSLYMGGEVVSMLGTWMQQMAQGWVLASLTTSAFTLGLVTFASSIPMIALTMFGGVI